MSLVHDNSIKGHRPLTWESMLDQLSSPVGLFNQRAACFINEEGGLDPLDGQSNALMSPSAEAQERLTVQSDHLNSLIELIHPAYQDSLRRWLSMSFSSEEPRVIICPLILERLQWVELSLCGSDRSQIERIPRQEEQPNSSTSYRRLLLTDISDSLYRQQLSARSTGLIGLKHDLANRLFLFKALPQLLEFSPPEELINDVVTEIPNLLSFIEARLSPTLIESLNTHELCSPTELIDQLQDRVNQHPSIATYFKIITDEHIHTDLNSSSTPVSRRPQSLLGLEWSLSYLALLVKRRLIILEPGEKLNLCLSYAPKGQASFSGQGGMLCPDVPSLSLKLTLPLSVSDLSETLKLWKRRTHINTHSSDLKKRDTGPQLSLVAWWETWINASYMLMGNSYLSAPRTVHLIF